MSPKKKSPEKGFLDGLYDFFCSIKLSIWVLIALAITSIFGTVIQQGKGHGEYVREYGEQIANIIEWFVLDDMYHSWWFILLLALLLINITFCSIKRLPLAVRLMRDRNPVFDGRAVALHEKWETRLRGKTSAEVAAGVEGLLARKLSRPVREEVDGKIYLFASKGGWTRMGVYVTHFSLFLFALGAMIGGWTGFKGFVNIPEGETVSRVQLRTGETLDLDFGVRLDQFELEFYTDPAGRPTGRPKDYKSHLAVVRDGRVVETKVIEVNDPLIYEGIYFYQSSYGQAGGRGAWLSVYGAANNLIAYQKRVDNGGRIPLQNGDTLLLRATTGDFRGMGPAAEVVLQPAGGEAASTVLFERAQGSQREVGGYKVRLHRVESSMYTGLQVAKDPGVPVIWAGCILITLGCLVAFFLSHRRVWARISPEEKGVRVFLGGNASRNRVSFERWFEDLCESTQETFEK